MKLKPKEQKLMQKLVRGDQRALHEFYHTYEGPLHRFAYRQLGDRGRAQEVVQEIFYDFIERLRDFRGESSLKTFLFAIARNKTIDVIRRRRIKQVLFSRMPDYVVEGLKAVFMDEEIDRRELARRIEQVFAKLPNDYQIILRLKYIEGEQVANIANRLKMNFKATESLLYRARQAFIKVYYETP